MKDKMSLDIKEGKSFDAFAIVVDINAFTRMVKASEGFLIAQFTRDVLTGAIDAIEKADGEVVGLMGDAILGLIDTADNTALACFAIAKDLDAQCEYISQHQEVFPQDWNFARGGPSLKIGIEFGTLDVSTISSRLLGESKLVIGDSINYATRIMTAGTGNRCNVGPKAAVSGLDKYSLSGPSRIKGKRHEGVFEYFTFDLGDIWIQGQPPRRGTY